MPDDEINKLVDAVISMIKDKGTEEKIKAIKMLINVMVIEDEVWYPDKVLRKIIIARMKVTCPRCNDNPIDFATFVPCTLCNGKGEVMAVEAEKYYLNNMVAV